MNKKNRTIFFILSFVLLCVFISAILFFKGHPSLPILKLTPKDRILILAPHPDDEVVSCAGVIQEAVTKNIPVRVVYLTYGDSLNWAKRLYPKEPELQEKGLDALGLIRYEEALSSARILGLKPEQLMFLGYPDGRIKDLWLDYWGGDSSLKNPYTETGSVLYDHTFCPGRSYSGESLLGDLKDIMLEFKPTKIFCSHPSGEHTDHRTLYLFTRVALWDLEGSMDAELYPCLVHFTDWPKMWGYHPFRFLRSPLSLEKKIDWSVYYLTVKQMYLKRKALMEYKTQYRHMQDFLMSFVRRNELFGDIFTHQLICDPSSSDGSGEYERLSFKVNTAGKQDFKNINKIDGWDVKLYKGSIMFRIKLARPLKKNSAICLYVFGYRKDTPFSDMPKLKIFITKNKYGVFNKTKLILSDDTVVARDENSIAFKMPLSFIKEPTHIMTSVMLIRQDSPPSTVSWEILDMPTDYYKN